MKYVCVSVCVIDTEYKCEECVVIGELQLCSVFFDPRNDEYTTGSSVTENMDLQHETEDNLDFLSLHT